MSIQTKPKKAASQKETEVGQVKHEIEHLSSFIEIIGRAISNRKESDELVDSPIDNHRIIR